MANGPRRSLTTPTDERPNLDQGVEFRRFLTSRKADAERDSDRLEADIETLLAEIDSKRKEQSEHDEIAHRCDAALTIDLKANRPAPQLTPRVPDEGEV